MSRRGYDKNVASQKGAPAESSRGLVLRTIKADEQANQQVGGLLQQLGELYFGGRTQIEELDPQEAHSWIKFSTSVARAQNNLSKLAEVLEEAVRTELDADLRLIQAEVENIEERRSADLLLDERNQARREALEDAEEKRTEGLFEEDKADRIQQRDERRECHEQGMRERETRRKTYRLREGALIGITIFCVLLAAFLVVFGVTQDKLIFIGGSGVSILLAIAGFAKLIFGWGDSPVPPDDPGTI
jgi:hypothetical protein